jgi:hypothetical protein
MWVAAVVVIFAVSQKSLNGLQVGGTGVVRPLLLLLQMHVH